MNNEINIGVSSTSATNNQAYKKSSDYDDVDEGTFKSRHLNSERKISIGS